MKQQHCRRRRGFGSLAKSRGPDMCFLAGLAGAACGWMLAASMPMRETIALISFNPAYSIFLFCTNQNAGIICSLIVGSILAWIIHEDSPFSGNSAKQVG